MLGAEQARLRHTGRQSGSLTSRYSPPPHLTIHGLSCIAELRCLAGFLRRPNSM